MSLRIGLQIVAWLVAIAWLYRLVTVWRGLPQVADLLASQFDALPDGMPSLAVVLPARNEAADVQNSLRALVVQDYPNLRVIAVNDRSTDETGRLMREVAAESPERLSVIDITELPTGWLGKTHAMARAAAEVEADYLLFTDADVLFRSDALRRSLCCAVREQADHFVTLPTTIIRRWDEAALLGFFQLMGLWAVRLWRIPDAQSRDALGVGAFNLIKRTAYEQVGGFGALRMEIIEDVGLARRVKNAGLRSQVAFGHGLVSLHWASGAAGIVDVMTKNMFSAFRFHASLLLLTCGGMVGFAVLPFAGLFWLPTLLPALLTLGSIAGLYQLVARHSGLTPWNALLTPFAALAFVYALLRSMVTTLYQGGVRWRGTFYPLAELRRQAAPLPRLLRRRGETAVKEGP